MSIQTQSVTQKLASPSIINIDYRDVI